MTTEQTKQGEITYREAIAAALLDEMRADPKVLVMGEDVGEAEGPFKTTVGLYQEFGPLRVRDTPIAEEGFVGAALGLALAGYRPVVEIMFSDFLGICYDQLANSIAKHRFMAGGRMNAPLVVRAIGGGGSRFGAQHSQSGETWLLPFPGLKIVTASSPQMAYTLLRAAIRDDDPVLLIEHKGLLAAKGEVDRNALVSMSGLEPARLREGDAITLVASLAMVPRALAAADQLAAGGVSCDVFDIRALRPLRTGPILDSVRRTRRLLLVEENPLVGGWTSHVLAEVAEAILPERFSARRLGLPEHPLPYSPALEDAAIPSTERIVAGARALVEERR